MTRDTSIETYHAIRDNGLLSRMRFFVYEILYKHGPMTGNQLIQHVGRIRNSGAVTTRLSELRTMGVVYEVTDDFTDPITGNRVILWDVTSKLPSKFVKPKRVKCPHCDGKGFLK